MAANHPEWQFVGFNTGHHPKFAWPDANGNVHAFTGFIGQGGTKKSDIGYVGPAIERYLRRCEQGACTHVFSGSTPTAEPTPAAAAQFQQQEAPQLYQPGTQVVYDGAPWWVGERDGTLYYLQNNEGEEALAEHHELSPYDPTQHEGHIASILDPIHATLDPRVFDQPAAPEPTLRPELQQWLTQIIFEVLQRHGYHDPADWLTLVLTGSLTTYQYSDGSDIDISLFVDSERLPDWSRAEMISFMISDFDNVRLPGTPYPVQAFVVSPKLKPQDLYKPGLRSGFVVYGQGQGVWLVPPDPERAHDVEAEMNDAYTVGLLAADKLDLLLQYEPDHAVEYWHTLHKQRMADQTSGRGDYSTSNVVYKMLVNRGLAEKAARLAGDKFMPA